MLQQTPADPLDRRHRGKPEIEYLRAMAILFVMIMHVPLLCMPYPAGALGGITQWIHPATGVDLFFVISGYLIGRSFMGPFEAHEHGADRVARITEFWVRRFYRLMPASALWVGLTFLASCISNKPALWLTPHGMFFKAAAALFAVRNFEESQAPSFFGYYWSLSVENQFYLALPLLLLVVKRSWRIPGMLALCALNAVWRPGGDLWWLFRYDGLIYGLLLFELERAGHAATLARSLPASGVGRTGFMLVAGAVVLIAPLALIEYHPLAWTVVNWGAFALVLAASRDQGVIVVPPGLRTAMLWLGARSYSVYLCHIPIWMAVIDVSQRLHLDSQRSVPARIAVGLVCTMIAADLTYRWVEVPLQVRGRDRARAIRRAEDVAPAPVIA
jgi:peptidoglycan/LPS O-acetylase OafA/YrhL